MAGSSSSHEQRVPLVSEEAEIETRETVTERARLSVRTERFTENVRTELASEDVEIRHVPRGELLEPGSALPEMREEDGVTIVPVLEEIAVVEKRLRLKEEIHIIRRQRSETVVTPVTLRQQSAVLEQLPVEDGDAPQTTPSKTD